MPYLALIDACQWDAKSRGETSLRQLRIASAPPDIAMVQTSLQSLLQPSIQLTR